MVYLITFYFIALDFVTGFFQALATGTFASKVMRQGLFHKVALLLVMLLGWLVDYAQQFVDLGVGVPVGAAVCVYIILMEVGSSLENLGKMNPELTDKLGEIFGRRKPNGDAPSPERAHKLEEKGGEECEVRH